MTSSMRRIGGHALPIVFGIAAFLLVVGPRPLYPTNIAWLGHGDPATHYLGWYFFRNADWLFPIGLNPNYGIELGNAILFSDSNPLLAFLFKPFRAWLPETFQYFGFWLLLCFVLQAWFGWKLAGLMSDSALQRLLIAGLLVFAPPMLWRLHGHISLTGHFLVLAALYLCLRPQTYRRAWAWGMLLIVTALVHAYLLAMVALLWLADLAGRTRRRQPMARHAVLEMATIVPVVAIACWQAGYFSVGAGTSGAGFGVYRLNLLSLFNPLGGWSYVLRDIPVGDAHTGSNFLGLGLMFLALLALPVLVARKSCVGRMARRFPALLLALVALTFFALTNKLSLGPVFVVYPLPDVLLKLANVFRASERMFWPVFYALSLAIVFVIVRGYERRWPSSAERRVLMQVIDTSGVWRSIRQTMMAPPSSTWPSTLVDPFWDEAATRYKKLRWVMPVNAPAPWSQLALYAGKNKMVTDATYLARIGDSDFIRARLKAANALVKGEFEADALYVLDDESFRLAADSVDRRADLLAKIDGLNVLAPGWNKCSACAAQLGSLAGGCCGAR